MKNFLFILSIFILVSCTSNTIYQKPKDLIPKDTMVALVHDLLIAKSAKNQKNKNQEVRVDYLPLVYNKYKIDSTRFKESNFYYTSKIEIYEELMLEVKKQLSIKEEKYTSELKIKDSIERSKRKKVKAMDTLKLTEKKLNKKLILDAPVIPIKKDSSFLKKKPL